MGMIKGIEENTWLGGSSCTNTSQEPSKGVITRACTSSKVFSDSKHASTILNLATTPKCSPILSPVH